MLDKLSQLAEQAATGVSRRQFLGRIGGAAALAGAIASVLANESKAGHPAVVCDANSIIGCRGAPVGHYCKTVDGNGTCKPFDKGSTTCGCALLRRSLDKTRNS
jgi:hypothetical protein